MLLNDNETKIDLLNNEPIATTIVELIRKQSSQPTTIGIHGDWGAGKSSILEMIQERLETDKNVLCIKFNGWRFQGFENAKIALLESIVESLVQRRDLVSKAADAVKSLLGHIDWLKAFRRLGTLGSALLATTHGMPELASAAIAVETVNSAAAGVADSVKSTELRRSVPTEIEDFRREFAQLLSVAGVEQLVVLVDDLDRCLPETAIETLEAIRLFMLSERTAFVIAADEAMIELAVRKHFPNLGDSTSPSIFARNYLEKLIQVPFQIPTLGEVETKAYVTLLLVGAELVGRTKDFEKVISLARSTLKEPWASSGIDGAAIKAIVGQQTNIDDALNLSEQVGSVLAQATRGNPRQIKRFINSLRLRRAIAKARGFEEKINVAVLAKLMLAERFNPRLFEQVASGALADPNGKCQDLLAIEQPSASESAGPVLAEWLTDTDAVEWARGKPFLASVDLRPYLFISRDRRDRFGATGLGHLATLFERLAGGRLSAQSAEADARGMSSIEAARLVDALIGRVIAAGGFEKTPTALAGVLLLAKLFPQLQIKVVELLERIPSAQIGAWAATGWNAITDASASTRLTALKLKWSADGSKILQAALKAGTKRVPEKGV